MSANVNQETVVTLNPAERLLEIKWSDGEISRYHYVWLRHSARCSTGMPNDTSVKIDLLPDDPATLVINACHLDQNELVIDWQDDGLQTRHDLITLQRFAYDAATTGKIPPAGSASRIPSASIGSTEVIIDPLAEAPAPTTKYLMLIFSGKEVSVPLGMSV